MSVVQWWWAVLWWFVGTSANLQVSSTSRSDFEGINAISTPRSEFDAVNVISVENMDALLRLRFAPEADAPAKGKLDGRARNDIQKPTTGHQHPESRALRREPYSYKKDESAKWPQKPLAKSLCDYKSACVCVNAYGYLNISCKFTDHEDVELSPGSIPSDTIELIIENAATLNIHTKTFSNMSVLNTVAIHKVIRRLHIQNSAFTNVLTHSGIFFQIKDCGSVILDDSSFHMLHGPATVDIRNCGSLSLGSSVFPWLGQLAIVNVPNLILVENTFSDGRNKVSKHGPGASIEFVNVTIETIPNGTFRSSAQEIGFKDCKISIILPNAFNAAVITRIYFEDTTLATLMDNAFSTGLLVHQLSFQDCDIDAFKSRIVSAVTKLYIDRSRIREIQVGAFNVSAASVQLTNNHFKVIQRGAFVVKSWNDIVIYSNEFENLVTDAFIFPFKTLDVFNYSFIFNNNHIVNVSIGALAFIPREQAVDVRVEGNRFDNPCSCYVTKWVSERAGSEEIAARFLETSSCHVSDWLANCFKLSSGAVPMINYTEQVCGDGNDIPCKEASRRMDARDPSVDWGVLLENEKRVFTFIILTVLCCVCFIIIVVSAMWIKKKGLIGRIISQVFRSSSLVASTSISRVNIHEYAEIQNLRNQTQTEILEEEDVLEMVPYDDKATQTLPEELTQDLLQSLREKLDDPENYREARDMIEHLYDLIKVEESCNTTMTTIVDEDNLYAEVRPRMRPRTRDREVTNVGTRSPSLDKLSPVTYLPRPAVVNDYAEPRDRHVSTHVYCELPGGTVPDVLMSTRLLANRPLPEAPSTSRSYC